MLYVALSRVTSLNGLHILGNFRTPKLTNEDNDSALIELKKLKTEKNLFLSYDEVVQLPPSFNVDKNMIDSNNNLLELVLNPKGYLTDYQIDSFHKILRDSSDYRPQDCILGYLELRQYIQPIAYGTKNIQILFQPGDGIKESDVVGHWLCTYFDGAVNHIYDSLNQTNIHQYCEAYIQKMYTANIHNVFNIVQHQLNMYDCGVFAMAFATSLYFGRDPQHEIYEVGKMRKHAAKILKHRQLELFPSRYTE